MRPPKLIIPLAAAICALAVSSARGTVVPVSPAFTNFVSFGAVAELQGETNSVDGTNTAYAKPVVKKYDTASLFEEISSNVVHAVFSKEAKLVYIEGGFDTNGFAVIDGTNFYSISNVMSLNIDVSTNKIRTGVKNGETGLAFKALTDTSIVSLNYDDTGVGGSLEFSIQGIATATTTDTVPSSSTGAYTETKSAKLTATGSGVMLDGFPSVGLDRAFIVTVSMTFSGSGQLVYSSVPVT